jgi:ribosomal protein S18 acetylase RimI-like enzyme
MNMANTYEVTIMQSATPELAQAFEWLMPQLSASRRPPTLEELAEIIASRSALFAARMDGKIVGSLTLAVFRTPTGLHAHIEDVVVDCEARGQGIGAALTLAGIEKARELGCDAVDLTSNPKREAANRLYQRLGFQRRETNVYRFDLNSS